MAEQKTISVSTLQYEHERKHPNSHFFDRDTLKFFGERISDMRVLKGTVKVTSVSGDVHTCYMLSSLQRKAPGGPKRTYHYFDTETFDHIITNN